MSMATGVKRRNRVDLSISDKVLALNLLDQKISQSEVARRLGCSQSQVYRLLLNREAIFAIHEGDTANPDRKRMRFCKAADVGDALLKWYIELKSPHVPMSTDVLTAKTTELARRMGKGDFVPSVQWIWRCKARNGLIAKKKGECGNKTKNVEQHSNSHYTECDRLVAPSFTKQKNHIDWPETGENDAQTSQLINTCSEQDKYRDSDESVDQSVLQTDSLSSHKLIMNV